jgi:mannose-1-phosphate guanylyltransferase/mannose-6-phosphate isomerase
MSNVKVVILAGGSGTRLWPLSRMKSPKQFIKFFEEKELLKHTIDRLSPLIDLSDILIVTGVGQSEGAAYSASQQIETLFEPVARNTAPAIAIAAAFFQGDTHSEDPIMIVLPADHIIRDVDTFQENIKMAIEVAKDGRIVVFGVRPTNPDVGFGYIKVDSSVEVNHNQALTVKSFVEKPERKTAIDFLKDSRYFWNSGMFVWKVSTILGEIESYLPKIFSVNNKILDNYKERGLFQESINLFFENMPNISIDYGVLEKSKKVSLIECDVGWSDIGSWDAIYDASKLDSFGNSIKGNVISIDCNNSLIYSSKRLVATLGIKNLHIVETADAILIAHHGEGQRVREIVDKLKHIKAQEHLIHVTVERPWGSYTVLEELPGSKMKRIIVNPKSKLSLQRHKHRSEHWIVTSGIAIVTRNEEVFTISKNQSVYIPIFTKHRLENKEDFPLEIIEVQVGEYLEEDDIERFDDQYGRVDL